MKTTIYEVVVYPKGSISAEIQVWRLISKITNTSEKQKKREKKRIYLHLDKAA